MQWMFVRRATQMTGLTMCMYELYNSQFVSTEGVTAQCSEAKVLLQKYLYHTHEHIIYYLNILK